MDLNVVIKDDDKDGAVTVVDQKMMSENAFLKIKSQFFSDCILW